MCASSRGDSVIPHDRSVIRVGLTALQWGTRSCSSLLLHAVVAHSVPACTVVALEMVSLTAALLRFPLQLPLLHGAGGAWGAGRHLGGHAAGGAVAPAAGAHVRVQHEGALCFAHCLPCCEGGRVRFGQARQLQALRGRQLLLSNWHMRTAWRIVASRTICRRCRAAC